MSTASSLHLIITRSKGCFASYPPYQNRVSSSPNNFFAAEHHHGHSTAIPITETLYLTFNKILQNPAFQWDRENNVLHAPYDAWVDMIRRDPFADAYLKRGEPSWNCLKIFFELRRVVRPMREPKIISISSGESDDSSDDGQEDDSIEDGEEDDIAPTGDLG
ncbi:hypothetical protein Salat_2582900 [Sesamum alatum]|uniref:Uncharacterized protein n=1 Tax=Sesamum alatum TaxID=300844 RepID=A0AAE1XMN2_9LAMI|nr:hypothetical protein Salat_2582900 [Sesamum alatum]